MCVRARVEQILHLSIRLGGVHPEFMSSRYGGSTSLRVTSSRKGRKLKFTLTRAGIRHEPSGSIHSRTSLVFTTLIKSCVAALFFPTFISPPHLQKYKLKRARVIHVPKPVKSAEIR